MIICALVILAGQAHAAGRGDLVFADTICDLGTIAVESGYNTAYFNFTNRSDSTIHILGALSDCGCAVPTYPHQAIAPGEGGTVSVTYDTLGRPAGAFAKVITLILSGNRPRIRLRLHGNAVTTMQRELWR